MGILQDCYDAREFNRLKLLLGLGHDPNELNELIIKNVCKYAVPLQKEDIQLIEAISEYWYNFTDADNNNLLHCVCKRYSTLEENIPLAEVLIKNGVDVNARDLQGRTPLFLAVKNSAIDVIELFIRHGADVNAKNNDGHAPLFFAKPAITGLLIEMGADENAPRKERKNPFFKNAASISRELAELLLDHHKNENLNDFKQVYHILKEWGVKIDADSTLFASVSGNITGFVETLILKGADVNAKNKELQTPLFKAAYFNHKEVAEMLIANWCRHKCKR